MDQTGNVKVVFKCYDGKSDDEMTLALTPAQFKTVMVQSGIQTLSSMGGMAFLVDDTDAFVKCVDPMKV